MPTITKTYVIGAAIVVVSVVFIIFPNIETTTFLKILGVLAGLGGITTRMAIAKLQK